MADRRILLTAFEPFGDRTVNSSAAVLQHLHQAAPVRGLDLRTALLPVSFARAWPTLQAAVDALAPDALVLLGQAARRTRVEVERVAVNVADTTTPDNDGASPRDAPVLEGGPAAHLASLPADVAVSRIRAVGTPAAVSHHAGTFVCNHTYYLALHHVAPRPVAFVHLPLLPEQALDDGSPTMSLPLMAAGVRAVLEVASDSAGQGARR